MHSRTTIDPSLTPQPRASRFVRPLVAVLVLVGAGIADAALTTDKCLIQKRQAWSTFRKCQAGEDVKRLRKKTADLPKCETKFQEKLTKIDAKAAKAGVACRYGANGDGTVTDYDTALMWETKEGEVGGLCLIFTDRVNHCVNTLLTWVDAQAYVHGATAIPSSSSPIEPFLAGHTDWRLPTLIELKSIVTEVVCSPSPCIDPIFGPTLSTVYWTSTTQPTQPIFAWAVVFDIGAVVTTAKTNTEVAVRAVRTAW